MTDYDEVKLDKRVAAVTLAGSRITSVEFAEGALYLTLSVCKHTIKLRPSEGCDELGVYQLVRRTEKKDGT